MSLSTNLKAYWRLDGASTDSTINANNGTDTNITYSAGNGIIVQGAGFASASPSKIVIADAASLKPTNNFTINLWFKTSTSATTMGLFQSWSQNTNMAGIRLWIDTTGTNDFRFDIGKNTGTTEDTDWKQLRYSQSGYSDGNWHMITCIYDGLNMYLYLDAVQKNSTSWSGNPAYAATNYVRMGALNNTGSDLAGFYYNGAEDEMGLWSRALSAFEIKQLYNNGNGLSYYKLAATSFVA